MGKQAPKVCTGSKTAALVADIKLQPWYLKNRNGYNRAIDATLEIGGSNEHQDALIYALARACVKATEYRPEDDPNTVRRKLMEASRDGADKLAEAVHQLMLAAQRNDTALDWAIRIAADKSGIHLESQKTMGTFFRELKNALSGRLPEVDGGPFLHRTANGNLLFDKPIGKEGRAGHVDVITMLAFELVYWLRVHSLGWDCCWQQGAPMPKTGRPRYAVAALWIEAALGKQMTAENVQDRIRKRTGPDGSLDVVLMEWPSQDGKLLEK